MDECHAQTKDVSGKCWDESAFCEVMEVGVVRLDGVWVESDLSLAFMALWVGEMGVFRRTSYLCW